MIAIPMTKHLEVVMSDYESSSFANSRAVTALGEVLKFFGWAVHWIFYTALFVMALITGLNALVGILGFFVLIIAESFSIVMHAMETQQVLKLDYPHTHTYLQTRIGHWLAFLVSYALWKFYGEISEFSKSLKSDD